MKKLCLLALVFAAGLLSTLSAQEATVIANSAVGESKLTAEDVKNILLGTKTKWDNGTVIKLVVLADGPVHEKVIKDFTQRTPDQYDKYLKKQVFTGKGVMPHVAKTEQDALAYVAKTPGAFGYVAKENVSADVKALSLSIMPKMPGRLIAARPVRRDASPIWRCPSAI